MGKDGMDPQEIGVYIFFGQDFLEPKIFFRGASRKFFLTHTKKKKLPVIIDDPFYYNIVL